MFYSHEILTSPEHGVATIWLVATLGSRSVSRRLNRKAIQDVDVPNACRVIINPEAPMALRLQGSLLYGVSRVYNQQCGYTLLDTQAMHDKMVTQLKIIQGTGLDPTAGQAKPNTLLLPYDPSFLPETGLPGLEIDMSAFASGDDTSQMSSLWSRSPVNSLSIGSQLSSLRLEIPSDGGLGEDSIMGLEEPGKDVTVQIAALGLEEGVLLQPDFEFDEDGNLIELGKVVSPRKNAEQSGISEQQVQDQLWDDQMLVDEPPVQNDQMDIDTHIPPNANNVPPIEIDIQPPQMRRIRQPKVIITDEATSLRNMELGRWNSDYVSNMTEARKQKQQTKNPSISKKNAEFWVFGQGIGSVGMGLGIQHSQHPLNNFSGPSLLDAVCQRKRKHTDENPERNVRPKEEELSRANLDRHNMDEVGRDAPSSILDDRSSQMPWNITASIKSSLRPRRFGSSEISSRKGRSRLASASPLAGRGYRDIEDLDFGDDLDLTRYLEGELATDRGDISSISPKSVRGIKASLDAESLHFFDFMKSRMGEKGISLSPRGLASPVGRVGSITFAGLMPPVSTTRAVATQALVHVLTLATKGVVCIHQDRGGWSDESDLYGEIHLRFT
ncbi:unnamed protein product [Penicillium salamii]|uniref:Rad21/Rec8-like protein N-terminal domain-containing protein n=1 Tax=Penicillium salamii TaxID=1612424 RepID=A0A9W4NW07_9EURO|nr:unnamed protein product [Penicillium salamii]CAG8026168.1 unnamed protein product [Penicillium salamii]CAG8061198.1 unnamed protein product [Penicillium salamii]CAG8081839.1 unnamed protein product [Penicillium salamii]CAG8185526.1 unnamed protein product [Penicillium salamii]